MTADVHADTERALYLIADPTQKWIFLKIQETSHVYFSFLHS